MNADQIYLNEVLAIALNQPNTKDPYRPSWHFSPPFGLLNDPNGLAYFDGKYHLFYQWNPKQCAHGAKAWGHAVSDNMLDWQHQPLALAPTESYETHGCYSGSGLVVDNKLELFYTGNVKFSTGGRTAYQCRATKEANKQVEKKGIVLELPEGYSGHVRDPKVWQHEKEFYMVLGAEDLHYQGKVLLYRSDNLNDWEYLCELFGAKPINDSPADFMLECPDFFAIENQHVLITCPKNWQKQQEKTVETFNVEYHLGQFDYASLKFTPNQGRLLDFGFDFYAPQTFVDNQNRRLLFGWMGKPDEFEPYQPSIVHGWQHAMTCPRYLSIRNGQLIQTPCAELQALRQQEQKLVTKNARFTDACAELFIENIVDNLSVNIADDLALEVTTNGLAATKGLATVRRNLKTQQWERKFWQGKVENLHILIDHSCAEVFINHGVGVSTSRFFGDNVGFALTSDSDVSMTHWQLKRESISVQGKAK